LDTKPFYVNFLKKESKTNKKLLKSEAISFRHQNTTDKVLLALQNKIIRRELKPNQRIYVNELSKEFNISQTPIREALYKLEGMNLVDIKPRKGIYVASSSKQDVLDILEVRMALENLAIQRISDISEDLIEKMKGNLRLFKETIKTKDFAANNKIDKAFHILIMEASGSKELTRIYKDLYSHISIERFLYKDNRKALVELDTTDKEHWRIVQAFVKKDKKEIKGAISAHFKNVKRRITKSL
jgi:DNA-binding GntR family transcriptional regulator